MPKRRATGRARSSGRTEAPAGAVRIVLSTAPASAAPRIARRLVESGLAACVNVVPGLTSVYRWQGKVRRARESLLIVKAARVATARLLRALVAAHPYEVPEALVLAPQSGLEPYLSWLLDPSPAPPT